MLRVFALLFAALPAAAAPTFLLPDNVTPAQYWIDLYIDPNQPVFEGTEQIDVQLKQATSVIWVNARDLSFHSVHVEWNGGKRAARVETSANEFAGFHVEPQIGPGRALLSIRYRGKLNEQLPVGPFRKKTGEQWSVYTTFTPIDARRAFPCFDEPRFKTKWNLTLHVRREHEAFANSPSIRTKEEPGGWKTVQFAPTEPLPAELVAFAVGRFDRLDAGRAGRNRIPVGVITPPGRQADGEAAARATHDLLPRLEAYTGIPYPYQKLDHIALPEGAFGATENPGLITYRMAGLLFPAGKETPPAQLRRMRGLQAHELAHQWFGNLVTQGSWEDTWLSEGFATWLSERILDEDKPPARRRLSAVVSRERIMRADESERALPVRRTLRSREEMTSVYNRFVYQKGAAVLLMVEAWVGEEAFRSGLRAYLKQHHFGIATTADLAAAIRGATGTDASGVMSAFLDQTGVPSVRIRTICETGRQPRLRIEQVNSRKRWILPVCWIAEGAGRNCVIVGAEAKEVELESRPCPAWVFPNAAGSGYHRTEWDARQLSAMKLPKLTAAERLTLVHDLGAMTRAGTLPEPGEQLLANLRGDAEPEIAEAAKNALESR